MPRLRAEACGPTLPLVAFAPPFARMLAMPRFPFRSVALTGAMLLMAATARGEPAQSCGRYLGVGWGDGYHSRTGCPPKRHLVHRLPAPFAPPAPAPVPWWKIPAADAETIPTPAP